MGRLSEKVAIVAGAGSIAERRRAVPSGQLGSAWDVAYGVLYLASDESKFVNATELIIDGGQTASTTGRVWED